MREYVKAVALTALLTVAGGAFAQSNLSICLDGRYPALCNMGALTPEQRAMAEAAVRRANRSMCLDGRYPALCNHQLLSPEELTQVLAAERKANLQMCLDGRYPALCNHQLLSPEQAAQVFSAERAANLAMCSDGRYAALCHHDWLTPAQARRVAAAEQAHESSQSQRPIPTPRGSVAQTACESGHWIQSVSDNGDIVELEDDSVWEVDGGDSVDSALWLPLTNIVACPDKLIDTDDNETVGATRLR